MITTAKMPISYIKGLAKDNPYTVFSAYDLGYNQGFLWCKETETFIYINMYLGKYEELKCYGQSEFTWKVRIDLDDLDDRFDELKFRKAKHCKSPSPVYKAIKLP